MLQAAICFLSHAVQLGLIHFLCTCEIARSALLNIARYALHYVARQALREFLIAMPYEIVAPQALCNIARHVLNNMCSECTERNMLGMDCAILLGMHCELSLAMHREIFARHAILILVSMRFHDFNINKPCTSLCWLNYN